MSFKARELFQRSVRGDRRRRVPERVDRVAPWLLIGPSLAPQHCGQLRDAGVTHIVDLRAESSDDQEALEALGFEWLRIPTPNEGVPTDLQFRQLLRWIGQHSDEERLPVLYLHCEGGLGRTPTVAVALLMQQAFTLAEASRLVRAARPEGAPSAAQQAWLESIAAGPVQGELTA